MPKKRRSLPQKPPPKLPPKVTYSPDGSSSVAGSVALKTLPLMTNYTLNSDSTKAATNNASSGQIAIDSKKMLSDSKKNAPDPPGSELKSATQILDLAASAQEDTDRSSGKITWDQLVKGPAENMEKKDMSFLLDSGELCVQIPNEVITRNHKRWESFIIGQFHGNRPSPGVLHAILNRIWSIKFTDITTSTLGPHLYSFSGNACSCD